MGWSGSLDRATLHAAYRAGELTPADVVAEAFRRIRARGQDNVWTALVPEAEALAAARALGPFDGRPLYGLPLGVKDSFDIAGMTTSEACRAFAHVATATSPTVTALTDAGCIVVGKNNMDQFGMGLVGVRTDYGVPGSAFDPAYISGGSTSGGGVAVAAGLVSLALGGDAAGSGRVPAALNNIVGLKPTPGLIPLGPSPAGMQASHSLLTLTVADAAAATQVLIGYDRNDPLSAPEAAGFALRLDPPPRAFRFGVPDAATLTFAGDGAAEALFARAVATFAAMGGTPVPVDMTPFFAAARMLYEDAFIARRYANLERFLADHLDALHPATREIVSQGMRYSGADVFRAQYRLAGYRQMARHAFEGFDVLLTPTTPTTFTIAAVEADNIARNALMGTYTNFVNLMDMGALALPAGFRPDGQPLGVSLVGLPFAENRLLTLGAAYERRLGAPLGATRHRLPG